MRRIGNIYVSRQLARQSQYWCNQPPGRDNCNGKDVPLFDKEFVFDNGMRMAVQVCPSADPDEEPCWTQGVLFGTDGTELGCTNVGESLVGEFHVYYGSDEYVVNVKLGTKAQLDAQDKREKTKQKQGHRQQRV